MDQGQYVREDQVSGQMNSKFSDFFRKATVEEKREVYMRVIDGAIAQQREVLAMTESKVLHQRFMALANEDHDGMETLCSDAIDVVERMESMLREVLSNVRRVDLDGARNDAGEFTDLAGRIRAALGEPL